MQTTQTSPQASPELLRRIDQLEGCQGHWLLIRDGEPEDHCSHQWHQSPKDHLQTCLAERWRGVSLGFCPSYCGFSDYSRTGLVGLANYRVLTDPASTPDPFGGILEVRYGWNGRGVVVDVLRAPADAIEAIVGLESYPLISEDEHSYLECFGIGVLWSKESLKDRVSMLQDLGLSVFAARRDGAPWELQPLYDSLIETLNEYPTLADG
jgi:hypothetical protein